MANNRMYLLHRPSGMAVPLGKRMGLGWYESAAAFQIMKLFDWVEDKAAPNEQDDFVIVMEDATHCFVKTEVVGGDPVDGLLKLELRERENG
jgi:hypothetical protein